jgi:Ca-activated chloride channel family protein
VVLYTFNTFPNLMEDWTADRSRLSRSMRRIVPRGGTAMYDALLEAVPLAEKGQHRKKAIVVISDGNDTNSSSTVQEVKQLIRDTELMVYAIGIDGESSSYRSNPFGIPRPPVRLPFPFPGTRRRPFRSLSAQPPWGGSSRTTVRRSDRVNAAALRELTDDSGGRTEIVRDGQDLDPATAGIAHELSQQYFLAYPAAAKKDGRWHDIRVEVRDRRYTVRSRRGYMAT